MNRTEKIVKLQNLNEYIKQKELQIEKEKKELQSLCEEYAKESESELPILLFLIDESIEMPNDERDYKYEYVYYCPDLDKIRFGYFHSKNELLPNTIDLTENFKDIGMPKRIRTGSAQTCSEYYSKIEFAVTLLKSQIDSLFTSNEINSWFDLATLLTDGIPNKVQSRILKENPTQK